MLRFTYQALPGRVIFGVGSLGRLAEEIERIGATRVLVLSTPGHRSGAREVASRLGDRSAGIFDRAVMHVPLETAEQARAEAKRLGADCCVAVGGGSTIGLAKAIALVSELPILAIPTTYSGSEMTPIWGLTAGGIKKTGRDVRVLPRAVIYDPALTVSMPPGLSGTSGMNAIAHAVEALYAEDANPIISLIAEEAIRALAKSLPVIVTTPENLDAWGNLQSPALGDPYAYSFARCRLQCRVGARGDGARGEGAWCEKRVGWTIRSRACGGRKDDAP
jgi:maleylacetate reductase